MANIFFTDYVTGKKTMPNAQGDEVLSVRMDFAVSTTMVDSGGTTRATLATNDTIVMGKLPAGHVPVDMRIVADAVDTGSTLAMSAGIMKAGDNTALATDANGDGGNISGTFISGATVGRTGAPGWVGPNAASAAIYRIKPTAAQVTQYSVTSNVEADRNVGILLTGGLAGVAAGTISMVLSYRAGHYGT